MSVEGHWALESDTVLGRSAYGTVTLETGRIFGGDSALSYGGVYTVDGNKFVADVTVAEISGQQCITAFGKTVNPKDSYEIRFEGEYDKESDAIIGSHWHPSEPHKRLKMKLTRLDHLP